MSWLLQCPEGQSLAVPSGTDLLVGSAADCGLRLHGSAVPAKLGVLSGSDVDVWLRVLADDPPIGVNGRPVRALARLVPGDRICFGVVCVDLLYDGRVGRSDDRSPSETFALRARGGTSGGALHHGPILHLDASGAIVPAAAGGIELALVEGRIRLAPGDAVVRVNGRRIEAPVELEDMDQLQVGACRYLVESVSAHALEPVTQRLAVMPDVNDEMVLEKRRSDVGALWWLIGIAGVIAALVSALLYFHG